MRGFHSGRRGHDHGSGHHHGHHGRGMMHAMMGGGFGGPRGGPFEDGPFGGGFGGPRGGGFGGGGFGGGGFGGGRRGKRFDGEQLRLMVLGLLEQGPEHGYQLIRAFAERSGGAYQPSPGVLYPLLTMLDEQELIAKVEEGGSRRPYQLTDAGRAEVESNREGIDAAFARLAQFAEMAGRTDGAPVRRAVHNMRAAIMERLGREGAGNELTFEVARIIDEATQKIERL